MQRSPEHTSWYCVTRLRRPLASNQSPALMRRVFISMYRLASRNMVLTRRPLDQSIACCCACQEVKNCKPTWAAATKISALLAGPYQSPVTAATSVTMMPFRMPRSAIECGIVNITWRLKLGDKGTFTHWCSFKCDCLLHRQPYLTNLQHSETVVRML